ncbi:MAG TPA: hypothetical protein VGO64_08170 [Candidatus Limnocylindrales bacterium]|nr:hypothetical protein [Candidatus Limnocylindrales bacterium]
MAAGIIYLDADDEITSAAARIRGSATPRVGLVVPYGSRIATSRMNFRLLSREAVVSNRRLSIIAGDAATRALAASAGLPVFGSVGEYDAASGGGAAGASGTALHADPAAGPDIAAPVRFAAPVAPPIAPPVSPGGPGADAAADEQGPALAPRQPPATLADSETVAAVGRADASAAPTADTIWMAVPAGTADPLAGTATSLPRPATTRRPRPRPAPRAAPLPERDTEFDLDRDDDEAAPDRRRIGGPVFAVLGLAALAVVVLAVAAYLFLPAATIAVTPRREPISVELTVQADPAATEVDAAGSVVPAVRIEVPVQASQTFTTTGKHVESAPATGQVTFENYNPVSSNSIAAGSIVSTEGGIKFRTLAGVTVPAGTFVLPSVIPSRRSVQVQAVKDGPEGNVPANAIRIVPPAENPTYLKVNNGAPTDGGVRTETPEIQKDEVDKAVAALSTQLQSSFDDAIANGAGAPSGTTLFPATATLGDPTPSVDPATLVGQAVPTFDLAVTATGTVVAVDPSPVRSIAEGQLKAKVGADHRLVDGSVDVQVGEGSVGEDGQVTFQATARAQRVAVLDPAQLRSLAMGKSAADAQAALARYGDVQVDLWPSWVSTVTGIDQRLTLTVDDGGTSEVAPDASSSAGPTATPTRPPRPSAVPSVTPSSSAPAASAP